MLVDEVDESLAGIASGANETNARGGIVGGVLSAERRVRVCVEGVGQA